MLINVKFRSFAALFVLLLNASGVSNNQKWVKDLIKYITRDIKLFQIVLIIGEDAETQDKRISQLVEKIQQEIPSQVIRLSRDNRINIQNLLKQSSVTTSLFITIPFLKKDPQELKATDTTDFLNQLSTPKTRPKCLMIALSEKGKHSYRKLFQNMWSNYFLDFTIFEIGEKQLEKSLLWNRDRFITTVYYFNPFSGIYTKQKLKKKTKLFPNKLQDLHGFEMKLGSFNLPPYLYVKRNSSGYTVQISGPDALFAEATSKQMNFRLSYVSSQEVGFGHWNCDDASKQMGFAYLVGNNLIRFITNQGGMVSNCERQGLASKSTGTIFYCVLIPILTENTKSHDASPTTKWIYFILLVFFIRIITILLKFDNDVWAWFEILRGSLGFTVDRAPTRSSERIAFFAILMAFWLFSSSIFAILTDTKLTQKQEMIIETLEELSRTNLIPATMENNLKVFKKQETDPVMLALIDKSRIVLSYQECIDMLVQDKNVACIIRETTARLALMEHKDANNDPGMKILKERVFFLPKVILFEPNSPYIRQVDVIISRLMQSGLTSYWEKQVTPPSRSHQWETEEELESVDVLIPLIFFISFGCFLSIVVFICELLIKYFDNRIHGVFDFFSQGSVF